MDLNRMYRIINLYKKILNLKFNLMGSTIKVLVYSLFIEQTVLNFKHSFMN